MTRAEAQVFFDRRVEAWRRKDVETLVLAHTEDGVLESPLAGRVVGHSAIENVYRGFMTSFPDMVVESPDLIMEGDRVVQLLTFSGTNTQGFMGVPPTGKKFTFPAALICTLRDGRVAHERRVYDFAGFLLEIGVIKVKLA
jgi:steroid delta-isomerase-like uncharacterized protein